jgi:hypothetical protein
VPAHCDLRHQVLSLAHSAVTGCNHA